MRFRLLFTQEAAANLDILETDRGLSKRLKAVRKALALLEANPRHPSLNTHKFSSLRGPDGEDVFEAYAEGKTPAAYRIFWIYGPEKGHITIIAITSHL
ncbi:MAG: hypothetical protein V2I67_06680 [Thermoanaerobaculales bacterium]|jgi:hypothetical protein|nr:hypothetical protein [Thermoanaerobaculales bacterium]